MLFTSSIRTYTEHRKRRFSAYEFLDQSAWSICGYMRTKMEEWGKEFAGDREFIKRFQSKDDKQHYSAQLELILSAILKTNDFAFEKHPDLGTTKRLDFRISITALQNAYVECTLAGDSFNNLSEENQKETIEEILDDIEFFPYFINVGFKTLSPKSISKKALINFIHSLAKDSTGIPDHLLIERTRLFENNGWQLEFSLFRKPEPICKRSLGMQQQDARIIDTAKPLLTALNDKKPAKYGDMKAPYIICVNTDDKFSSDNSYSQALFGQYAANTVDTRKGSPYDNGFFLNDTNSNTRVSAVLFCKRLDSYMLDKSQCTIWHNPFAAYPLAENSLPFDEYFYTIHEEHLERRILRKEKSVLELLGMDTERYQQLKEESTEPSTT